MCIRDRYYQTRGIQSIHVDDIYLGNGVSELITMSLMALCLQPLGLDQDGTADVVADVLELPALSDLAHAVILAGRRLPWLLGFT